MLLAVAASFGTRSVDTAFACSCAPPSPPLEARDAAAAVFRGTVSRIDRTDNRNTASYLTVTFRVSETWKGETAASLSVTTSTDGPTCGYAFITGAEYLVYAAVVPSGGLPAGGLQTSICSRTRAIVDAREDIAALGVGTSPSGAAGPGSRSGTEDQVLPFPKRAAIVAVALVIAVLALGGALIVKRMDAGPGEDEEAS